MTSVLGYSCFQALHVVSTRHQGQRLPPGHATHARRVDLGVEGQVITVEHHQVCVVEHSGYTQLQAAAASGFAIEDQARAGERAEGDRHGVATDFVVYDLVPPADVVRVGPGLTVDDEAEDQIAVGQEVHLVPTYHLRIGERRDGIGGQDQMQLVEGEGGGRVGGADEPGLRADGQIKAQVQRTRASTYAQMSA